MSGYSRRQTFNVAGGALALALGGRSFAAAPSRRVNVVMTQGTTGLVIHEIARSQGYFEQFGIDPNVLVVSDGVKCVAAVISGAADICIWSGFSQTLSAIERGAKIKVIAGSLNLPSLAVYSAKPTIQQVSDLAGKIIGIGALGSVLHQMIGLLLSKKGVAIDGITLRNVGGNSDIFKAVAAGTVDAGPSDVDMLDQQQKYGVHTLSDGLLWREIPEYTNQASYASEDAIKKDPDLLIRTLAAYAKAYRFVSGPGSKDAYLAAFAKATGSSDQRAVTQWNWVQEFKPFALDLTLSEERINLIQNLNMKFKTQRQLLAINSFQDTSLAKHAMELVS